MQDFKEYVKEHEKELLELMETLCKSHCFMAHTDTVFPDTDSLDKCGVEYLFKSSSTDGNIPMSGELRQYAPA